MLQFRSERAGLVRYHDLPGDETPIVFLHGLGCSGSHDYPTVASDPYLSAHRRILIDLPGAGYSERTDQFGYTVPDHADVVAELLGSIDLGAFILYGHSAGGAIALEVTRRLPGQVTALVLNEANLDPSSGEAPSNVIASQTEAEFVESGYREMVEALDDQWAAPLSNASPTAIWRLSKSLQQGQNPSGRELLYGLDIPKAFIFGEESLPDDDAEELAKHDVRVVVAPGVGHSMAWEDAAVTARAIAEALA